jgi:hypothetical protein
LRSGDVAAVRLQESSMKRATIVRRSACSTSLLFVIGLVCANDAYAQQRIGGCAVLPPDNIWNTPVDQLPVLANSLSMVTWRHRR